MYKCLKCGKPILKSDDGYYHRTCGAIFEEEDFVNDKKKYQSLQNLVLNKYQAKIKAAEDVLKAVETPTFDANIIKNSLNEILPGYFDSLDKTNNSIDNIKELIKSAVHDEVSFLSEDIIDKLNVKKEADDEHINYLAQHYNVPTLIQSAPLADDEYFVAPASLIRKSVESFLKKKVYSVMINYYADENEVKRMYNELTHSIQYLENSKDFNLCITKTFKIANLVKRPDNFKFKPEYTINRDGKKMILLDVPLRFLCYGNPFNLDNMLTAFKYWKICNCYIHDNGFSTVHGDMIDFLDLNLWRGDLKRTKEIFNNMYNFFKNCGVQILGD